MSIYQHFRPEEKEFVDQVLEWRDLTLERYAPKLTDFLDPRQQDIIRTLIGHQSEVSIYFAGGLESAERKRGLLLPPYIEAKDDDYGLHYFKLNYPKNFATIEHRELLGSLLGLGIKREKFGDLLFNDDRIQFVAASEVAPFIHMNLTSVGKHTVTCETIEQDELAQPNRHWEQHSGVVSSVRLDAVVAKIYNLSRQKAAAAITNGLAKVNWKLEDKPSFELQAGDYLSIRKGGRSRLNHIGGETKKGNIWIEYGILK